MKRPVEIAKELKEVTTVEELTTVFEGIASLRISKIRDRVVSSKEFFAELWQVYQGLWIDPHARLASNAKKNGRNLFLLVTSEGSLSGDIDQKIVEQVAADLNPARTDVMVIGNHGYQLVAQRGIAVTERFIAPDVEQEISVQPIISRLFPYEQVTVYYQTYISLMQQGVGKINLVNAVQQLTKDVQPPANSINARDYIFEPSIDVIAAYLESEMMGVALIQVIIESKLAQFASRFNAMNAAKTRAHEMIGDYSRSYRRAKRAESDERIKEAVVVLKAQ